MLILKVCGNNWKNESRDKRELRTYREMGADVAVLAKGEVDDCGRAENYEGFTVYRLSTKPLGKKVPHCINMFASIVTWSRFIVKQNPDAITGHDLLPGLTIAWISTVFMKRKPALIYDSHEFEIGRNASRNKVSRFFIKTLEKTLINKCIYTIVVNDTIADAIMDVHNTKHKPIVVRSTPDKWELDLETTREVKKWYYTQFSKNKALNNEVSPTVSHDLHKPFIVMYHGAVTTGRGIEQLIDVVKDNERIVGVILGDGSEGYIANLKNKIKRLKIEDKILFIPAVPYEEIWKYVSAADLSLMMIQPDALSYYYSLPNKFFESIQSLTPIVASNFPEMKKIIDQYNIGLSCDPKSPYEINNCVVRMYSDKALYERCKANLIKAKDDLCWDHEKTRLESAMRNYLFTTSQPYNEQNR